jgi:subtilisin-like proprotein convertase family protein
VTVVADTQFTWTVEAEFAAAIGYIPTTTPGSGDCGQLVGVLDPFAVGEPCDLLSITVCVGPGTHWFFVAPTFDAPVPCGAEYTATLECDNCAIGACCPGDGSCIPDVTEPQCPGDWLGEGTSCDPNPCPQPPPNDLCDDAIAVAAPSVTPGSTELATIDAAFQFCGTGITSPGVWYEVTGTGNTMTVDTCSGTAFDSKISVYCPNCTEPTCVGGNDDSCGLQSSVSWCSEAGETYLILVHGFGGQTGPFDLTVTDSGVACAEPVACQRCPGNGDCCDPAGNGSPSCNDEECCNLVCACDSFCCDVEWDSNCAGPNVFVPGCSALDLCVVCAPSGACCQGFACSIETEADCDAQGGRYLGNDTTCDPLPAGNATTYESGPLALAIPDADPVGLTHVINVPDSFTLGDVNMALSVVHTWVGDLCVSLTHNGTTVNLIQRMGAAGECHLGGPFGCGADNMSIVLDDQGTGGPIEGQCVADLGSPPNYVPNNPLSAFNGMDASGDWTLAISDNGAGDLGSLVEWSLILDEPGENPCIPSGACCLWPDACAIRSQENCEADRGVYLGDDTVCEAVGQVTVYEETVNIALPDGDPLGTSHTINVPDSFTIADLNVDLAIDHTWIGDVCVTLTHGATTVELIQRMGTLTGE